MNSLIKLSSILVVSAAATLSACGVTDSMSKTAVGQDAINGIDVNDDKADSMKQPTSKGAIAVDAPVDGSFTTHTAFHAYTYAFTGAAGTLQLDATGVASADTAIIAYKKVSNRWSLVAFNDDCTDETLNSCLTIPVTTGNYRFVVTTYDALNGHYHPASYDLALTCADGDCEAPKLCGGIAGRECGDGQFCNFSANANCGYADASGTCAPIPFVCDKALFPVCGCDGNTYDNACLANLAGVSVLSSGACAPPAPVACGARAGNTCTDGQFCHFDDGAVCGRADAPGTCETIPTVCFLAVVPVCGCDGVTYNNSCFANEAGTSVLSQGACPSQN